MTRTPRWLSRLVVVGAGSAAIAAGVVPLTNGVAFAGAGDTATTLSITPTSTTDTVGNCTGYKVTTNANAKFDVQIDQTTNEATTINFCDVTHFSQFQGATDNPTSSGTNSATFNCPDTSAGTALTADTAQCDQQFTANASGVVEFGVTSNSTGTMHVTAYNDQNANDQFSNNETPQAKATETWVANQAAANGITCQPSTQTKELNDTATWSCTVTTAQGTAVHAATLNVYYDVNNGPDAAANPNDVQCTPDTTNTTGSGSGHNGLYTCSLTNGGGQGTDNNTTFVDNNGNTNFDPGPPAEPNTNTSATFVTKAPNNSKIQADCSPDEEVADAVAEDGNGSFCEEPVSANKIKLTATVKATNAPASGVIVSWFEFFIDPTSDFVDGVQCTTDATGQCSVTVNTTDQADGDDAEFEACINFQAGGGTCSDDTFIEWHQSTSFDARNISVSPASSNQPQGGSQNLVATVTNRHGEPVPGACVGWNESGPGHFVNADNSVCTNTGPKKQDGSYDTTCVTGTDGTCQVDVVSQAPEVGAETVTATLDQGNYDANGLNTTECSAPAGRTFAYGTPSTSTPPGDESDGAAAGNCSANATVNWQAPTVTHHRVIVGVHLTCFSKHRHKVTCVAQLSKAISGVTVVLHEGTHVRGTAVTNSSGKARFHLSGLKRHSVHHYRAHAKKSSKTFSADSNVARVRVR
jgi:hypothetical protein